MPWVTVPQSNHLQLLSSSLFVSYCSLLYFILMDLPTRGTIWVSDPCTGTYLTWQSCRLICKLTWMADKALLDRWEQNVRIAEIIDRVASHRIASHRIASHRMQPNGGFREASYCISFFLRFFSTGSLIVSCAGHPSSSSRCHHQRAQVQSRYRPLTLKLREKALLHWF
jgi:hypothetical protein